MTPSELVMAFPNLKCTLCKTPNLMLLSEGGRVDGVFCRACLEHEDLSVEEIAKRIEEQKDNTNIYEATGSTGHKP